ncbi:hypothetical protein CEXT_806721 [Caerostris extrusa]|uniref:Uncharacterized protein n=1 Tax=Caerostris extrusa TaxID=172846 RepID=A0AAV4M7S7_CAEEX|nr:hypothetical protein CEXT_806721 [Caerostris extrusa]
MLELVRLKSHKTHSGNVCHQSLVAEPGVLKLPTQKERLTSNSTRRVLIGGVRGFHLVRGVSLGSSAPPSRPKVPPNTNEEIDVARYPERRRRLDFDKQLSPKHGDHLVLQVRGGNATQ